MLDQDGLLLLPDRQPVLLREVVGTRGLVVVGVGRGAERGFQMVHRFHDVGEQLAEAGVNLAFVYPWESARHVMDPVSVASTRFRRYPRLILDSDHCFGQEVPPRTLTAVHLSPEMRRLAGLDIDLHKPTWEIGFRAFLAYCQMDLPR